MLIVVGTEYAKTCNHPEIHTEREEFEQGCSHCHAVRDGPPKAYLEPIGF